MLAVSCLIGQTGQTTVMFAGELDIASADQALVGVGYRQGAADSVDIGARRI
jgi:hypothetical protein